MRFLTSSLRLVQAGKEGQTAPLLSTKLHTSWIADVQLISTRAGFDSQACASETQDSHTFATEVQGRQTGVAGASAPLLLSASNDGTVALWDLSMCCEQGRHDMLPRQLAQTDALHTGDTLLHRSPQCICVAVCFRSCFNHKALLRYMMCNDLYSQLMYIGEHLTSSG